MLVVGIVHMLTLQMGSLAAEVPEYRTQIAAKISKLREATTESWVANVVEFANELVDKPIEGGPEEAKGQSLIARMDLPFMAILQSVAGTAAEILFNAVLILVLTLLMLMRREDLRGSAHPFAGGRQHGQHDALQWTTPASALAGSCSASCS